MCSEVGCDRPAHGHGLCHMHLRRSLKGAPMAVRVCVTEGCVNELRTTAKGDHCFDHHTLTSRTPERVCGVEGCNVKILASNRHGWCRAHRKISSRVEPRQCIAPRCVRMIQPWNTAGTCKNHGAARLESVHRYRARKRGLYVEDVARDKVLVDHAGICHLCALPVGADWHLEHVIPLALNGPHCYGNTAPAHPFCNLSKQARYAGSPTKAVDAAARAAYFNFHGRPFTG